MTVGQQIASAHEGVKWKGEFHLECRDKDGKIKWTEDVSNFLANEGQFAFGDVFLRGGTAPAQFNVALFKNTMPAPSVTSTLSTLKSPTNYELTNATDPGYGTTTARQQINRDATANGWTSSLATNYKFTAKTVSWTASSNWGDSVRYIGITTTADATDTTGKLVAVAQLSADRTLLSGDTLNVTYSITIS